LNISYLIANKLFDKNLVQVVKQKYIR